jgi:tetratricopeptide (TPR) repeat protein
VTASWDNTVRVWDITPTPGRFPGWFLQLAEGLCGGVLSPEGVVKASGSGELLKSVRETLRQEPADDWVVWGRWFFGDSSSRTISPFSKVTFPEWIVNRINEGTTNALREAERAAAATVNTNALAQVHLALAVRASLDGGDAFFQVSEYGRAERNYREGLVMAQQPAGRLPTLVPQLVGSLAAALYAQSKELEAERVINEAIHANDAKPDSLAGSLREKGEVLGQHGRRKEAVAALRKAVELQPKEHENWFRVSALLAASGNLADYRKHCHVMLERFANTTYVRIAERTSKVCLLLPSEGADPEFASQLADKAVALPVRHDDNILAYVQFVRCLAEYRRGNFTNAVEWARKVLASTGQDSARDAQAYSVLAMALHQLNKSEAARAALSNAIQVARTQLPSLNSPDLGGNWHDVVIADILCREAKGLIVVGLRKDQEVK